MSFVCIDCGEVFEDPAFFEFGFDHEFGCEKWVQAGCPSCQSADIVEANSCPKCGHAKLPDAHLCKDCAADLKRRVIAFLDTLTSDEEDLLDEWLDGDSVTNRENWEV